MIIQYLPIYKTVKHYLNVPMIGLERILFVYKSVSVKHENYRV